MQISANKIVSAFAFVICAWVLFLMLGVAEAVCKGDTAVDLESLGGSFGMLNSLFSGLAMVGAILAYLAQEESLKTSREALRESQEVARRSLVIARLKERPVFSAQVQAESSIFLKAKKGTVSVRLFNRYSDLLDVTLDSPHNPFDRPVFRNSLPKETPIEITLANVGYGSQSRIAATLKIEYLNAIGEKHACTLEISFFDSIPESWTSADLKITQHNLLGSVDATRPTLAGMISG